MKEQFEAAKLMEEAEKTGEEVFKVDTDFQKRLEEALSLSKNYETDIENDIEKEFLDFINSKLAGQAKAKKALGKAISLFKKIGKSDGVLASLFFAGPTGVGKTEAAKLLAEFLTGDKNNITIIQGSELQHFHDSKKLFGSPPSYVGFDQPPLLSDEILFSKQIKKSHPIISFTSNFAIILVDEVEKMHPTVVQSLLGLLNDGEVKFSTGKETNSSVKFSRVTDLTNTIWIFTSNVGTYELHEEKNAKHVGLIQSEDAINNDKVFDKAFEDNFSPEFRGRIDYKIVFESLKEEDLDKVIDIHVDKINLMLKNEAYDNIEISITSKLREYFKKEVNKDLGARNMAKLIKKTLENGLAVLNSNNYLDTAVVTGLKLGKKIVITFDLKDEHEKFDFPSDKLLVNFSGKKVIQSITKTQRELAENYGIKHNMNKYFQIGEHHESTLYIINMLKDTAVNLLVRREELNDFQKKIKNLKETMVGEFGKLDFDTIRFLSYCKVVENILDTYNPGTKEIDDISRPFKFMKNLSKQLGDENLIPLCKNKLKRLEKSGYSKEQSKILNNLKNIEDIYFTKKVKVIAFMLMSLEDKYLEEKNSFLAKKVLENLVKYFNSIY